MKNSWVDLRLWMSGGTKKEESRRRGQERKVWRQRGGWRDRSVYVSSFIHHTVPLWFNQTRNVFTKFDSGSTSECVAMQAPARQKYHPVKLKPLIKAIRSPKEAHRARLSLKWFLDKWFGVKKHLSFPKPAFVELIVQICSAAILCTDKTHFTGH